MSKGKKGRKAHQNEEGRAKAKGLAWQLVTNSPGVLACREGGRGARERLRRQVRPNSGGPCGPHKQHGLYPESGTMQTSKQRSYMLICGCAEEGLGWD